MTDVCMNTGRLSPEERAGLDWRKLAALLLIVGVVLAGNMNALFAGFVWDDGSLIVHNELIRHWSTLPALFTHTFLESYYRPVVMLSFAAEYALWGAKPFGFHLTNLMLHAANAIFVFMILKRVSRNDGAAFLGALLFAAHPVHKSVVSIADRTGLLSAFFYLGCLLLYMGCRDSKGRAARGRRYAASVVCCALAVFSKEEALTLPAMLVVLDLFLFHESVKENWKRSAALYLPFFIIPILYLWARAAVVGSTGGMAEAFMREPVRRLLTIPEIILQYIFLLVFPLKLDFDPLTPLSRFGPSTWAAALVVVSLILSIPWLFRRSKPAAFGLVWFFIAFIPMSNVIPVFPKVADRNLFTPVHFLYLPSIGLFLCAGYFLKRLMDHLGSVGAARLLRLHKAAVTFGIVSMILFFCLLSLARNMIWMDEISLFGYMVKMHPDRASARPNLANAYMQAGRMEEAVRQFEKAVILEPDSAEKHNGLGVAYLQIGWPEKAIKEFGRSIQLKPDDADPYANLAVAYVQKGMLSEAIAANEKAIELDPSASHIHTNLGLIHMQAGMLGRAEEEFQKALEKDPNDAETHSALGTLYARKKEYDKARLHLEKALRLRPDLKDARKKLESLDKKL